MVIRRDTSLDCNFKQKPPHVGDLLLHVKKNVVCTIRVIDTKFGHIYIDFSDTKERKRYTTTGGSDRLFRYLTPEEQADFRLAQANSNPYDSWSEL